MRLARFALSRLPLTRQHLTALALAECASEIQAADHGPKIISALLGAGLLRPVPSAPIRSGRYQITDAGRRVRDKAARMSIVPPGDEDHPRTQGDARR